MNNNSGEPITAESVAYLLEIPEELARQMVASPRLYAALDQIRQNGEAMDGDIGSTFDQLEFFRRVATDLARAALKAARGES